MKNEKSIIAIIGIGNIGYRHLQSLIGLQNEQYKIHVVEPVEDRLNQIKQDFKNFNVLFHSNQADLPLYIDLCIVSTQANVRFHVLEELVISKKVQYIIFEKILFQTISYYERANDLLQRYKIKSWVNCPRRSWYIYNQVLGYLDKTPCCSIDISWRDLDLGCNAIHFIDLIAFLIKKSDYVITQIKLPNKLKESKRSGNFDLRGKIFLSFLENKINASIDSTVGNTEFAKIMIKTSKVENLVVNEGLKNIELLRNDKLISSCKTPLQSEMTRTVVEEIIAKGTSKLPTYAESSKIHLPFIEQLVNYFKVFFPENHSILVT